MECVEAKALKTSFRPEMTTKSNQQQQVVFEDISIPMVVGDETFVDDFLDFSNEDVENEQGVVVIDEDDDDDDEEDEEDEEEKEDGLSQKQDNTHNSSNGTSVKNEAGSVFGSELSVPTDDLADLEWLSHFVEDSFSEFSLQHLTGNPSGKTGTLTTQSKSEPETPLSEPPVGFPIPIPAKARSKRSRAVRVWSIGGSSSLTETSSSSTTSTSSSSSSCLIFNNSGSQNLECFEYFEKPPAMKKHRKKKQGLIAGGGTQLQIRRCSHCGVQKTPQWRAGPNGAKSLCNACGVRFKSGRLLPEYRPACSPTFSSDVHSNNHRKVLEMRKKKEVGPPESGFAPAVHSF